MTDVSQTLVGQKQHLLLGYDEAVVDVYVCVGVLAFLQFVQELVTAGFVRVVRAYQTVGVDEPRGS